MCIKFTNHKVTFVAVLKISIEVDADQKMDACVDYIFGLVWL